MTVILFATLSGNERNQMHDRTINPTVSEGDSIISKIPQIGASSNESGKKLYFFLLSLLTYIIKLSLYHIFFQ